jgi:16S rRNA (uracil1498-N3)-methyltransferase
VTGASFFVADPLPPPGPFTLGGAEGRHAATVRRLRPGESVVLIDGAGGLARAVVQRSRRDEIDLQVAAGRVDPGPALHVTLIQALPKGDRAELAVELATEAGVDAVVPWAAERCVPRWTGERAGRGIHRWRAAAVQAAKQSRRAWIPTVAPLAGTDEVVRRIGAAAGALVLDAEASAGLAGVQLPARGELVLVVGPEGGITDAELALFRGAGARPVRLGPQVLRTSTAGAVALGALGVLTDRWSA